MEASDGGRAVNAALTEPWPVAVILAMEPAATGDVVIENDADEAPAGTCMVAGACATVVLLLDSVTVSGEGPTGAVNVICPVTAAPPETM